LTSSYKFNKLKTKTKIPFGCIKEPLYNGREEALVEKGSSFTVRDLPRPERPRERLQKFGAEVNAEAF